MRALGLLAAMGLTMAAQGVQRGEPGSLKRDFQFSADRSAEVVLDSGLPAEELSGRLDEIEKSMADRPFVVTRAKWLATVFDQIRLAVAGDDVFVDWFPGWQLLERRCSRRVAAFKARHPELKRPYPGAVLDTSHICPDWESILLLGPKGLAERARRRCERAANEEERIFLECVVEVYEAMSRLCVRWAATAEAVGAKTCAATLRAIAERPPCTLREALQLMLVYDRCQEAEGECVRSQGLFDRLYLKYYLDDVAAGRETRESAKGLVREVFVKMARQGHPNGKNFAFGGYGRDGRPVWNDLTEIAFELQYEMNVPNPKFTFRYGRKTPKAQLMKVARNLSSGRNSVVMFNEETAREMFLRRGKTVEDVADAVLVGCYEPAIQGREVIASMAVRVNLARPFDEIAAKGDVESYAAFESAYFAHLKAMIETVLADERVYAENWYELNPAPLMSGAFRDAVENARDCHRGSMKYNQSGVTLAGLGTVADSLAAARWLTEEAKLVTMPKLMAAMKANWRGYEELQLKARRLAPKWGNNDDRVDELAKKVFKFAAALVNSAPNGHGGTFQAGFWSIELDTTFGGATGATADGRKKGERLSRNNAATAGCGREGVTALMLSAAKLDQADSPDGFILDAVFPASTAKGEAAVANIVACLETFGKLGGQCIHLNCFDSSMLRDAQAHPERYRDLQVRVCGWNVRWNDLSKEDQDYFIATVAAQE